MEPRESVQGDAHREEPQEAEELDHAVDLHEGEPARAEKAHAPDPRQEQPEAEPKARGEGDRQSGDGESRDGRPGQKWTPLVAHRASRSRSVSVLFTRVSIRRAV